MLVLYHKFDVITILKTQKYCCYLKNLCCCCFKSVVVSVLFGAEL